MTTKFGRVPLWLYESGASLQAIAVYGWLAGRYGHYDRIEPSYGTLAKELGVSRGSAIAYVQALIDVRAVRIAKSGAKTQTSNGYEIAFDRPFPEEDQVGGGQNADQSDQAESKPQVTGGQNADLVSGLTSSGQNTDQGGQPAVHDIDLPKTQPIPPPTSPAQPADAAARATQEEEVFDPHPDAVAIIGKVDLGDQVLFDKPRAEAERILTAKLAEGWTVQQLLARFDGCRAASQPAGAFMARVRGIEHAMPPKPAARDSPAPRPCAICGDPFTPSANDSHPCCPGCLPKRTS